VGVRLVVDGRPYVHSARYFSSGNCACIYPRPPPLLPWPSLSPLIPLSPSLPCQSDFIPNQSSALGSAVGDWQLEGELVVALLPGSHSVRLEWAKLSEHEGSWHRFLSPQTPMLIFNAWSLLVFLPDAHVTNANHHLEAIYWNTNIHVFRPLCLVPWTNRLRLHHPLPTEIDVRVVRPHYIYVLFLFSMCRRCNRIKNRIRVHGGHCSPALVVPPPQMLLSKTVFLDPISPLPLSSVSTV
jgi:hypothetical protein